MKYAIVRINGHQYRVCEGDEILLDGFIKEKPKADILLFVEGQKILVGQPVLKDVELAMKIIGSEKGKKIDVLKYKAKSRYRKHIGFRPFFTKILIEKISSSI